MIDFVTSLERANLRHAYKQLGKSARPEVCAFLEWYHLRTPDEQAQIEDRLLWIIHEMHMRNPDLRFGVVTAIELYAAQIAYAEGWKT